MSAAAALGARLAEAERLGRPIALAELIDGGLLPTTVEDGWAAQKSAVEAIGRRAQGFKVSINAGGLPVSAPLLDCVVTHAGDVAEITKAGATGIEIEICFRLGSDIQPGGRLDREAVLRAIASVHIGAELLGSRIASSDPLPFPLFLADRLGNHAFAVGAAVEPGDVMGGDLVVRRDGFVAFEGTARHPQGDPLLPLLRYLDSPAMAFTTMSAGQVITTGSLCGIVAVTSKTEIAVSVGGKPLFGVRLG